MSELSRYVVETQKEGQPVLFDTVQKKSLSINTNDEQLKNYRFLAGQESQALNHYLFEREPEYLVLNISPTWLCNLRCGHCVVINRLVKQEPKGLDVDLIVRFIGDHIERYNTKRVVLRLAGGEPLLVANTICGLFEKTRQFTNNAKIEFTMTTNLAVQLGEAEIKALFCMDMFGVSIDGCESVHNKQRKYCDGGDNPFRQTIINLKKLMVLGMRKKISVQGAVKDDYLHEIEDYYRFLIKIGVQPQNIKLGCLHPTENKPEASEKFREFFRNNHFFSRPCCKYQFMCNFFIDPTDSIFSDYYSLAKIGNLGDSIGKIEEALRVIITSDMSVLNDPGCIQCPVVGYCWGGCSSGDFFWKGNPSRYCDQERLKKQVATMAKDGTIIDTELKDDERTNGIY